MSPPIPPQRHVEQVTSNRAHMRSGLDKRHIISLMRQQGPEGALVKMLCCLRDLRKELEGKHWLTERQEREIYDRYYWGPIGSLRKQFPRIDFLTPLNTFPSQSLQLLDIGWYRWAVPSGQIQTVADAGRFALTTRFSLTRNEKRYIKRAMDRCNEIATERDERRNRTDQRRFKWKTDHIFLFDTLARNGLEWSQYEIKTYRHAYKGFDPICFRWTHRDITNFANDACLCRSDEHDEDSLRRQRYRWRKARKAAAEFPANQPEFVKAYLEHEDQCRCESEALTVARARNPRIREATTDESQFLREKGRGWKLEETVTIGNRQVWLLSPPPDASNKNH